MKKENRDFYSGFEGEGEIEFIRLCKSGDKDIIRIWDGYFDDVMEKFEPVENGWTGLAYYYNLCEGWNTESPWKIPDVHDALKQLESIKNKNMRYEKSHEVLAEICNLLVEAVKQNEEILIADE